MHEEIQVGNQRPSLVARRRVLTAGGATLISTALLGPFDKLLGQSRSRLGPGGPAIVTKDGGAKPVFLPEENAKDPVAHSLAENLFWTDIMAEHAKFFAMLMPGAELAAERARVEQFHRQFADQFEKARSGGMDRTTYAAFNAATVELVKPFSAFKHDMRKAQESGRLRSLVWPLFFEHTAREADRFSRRLSELSRGNVEIDRNEAVDFWTRIMGEHADFIAHLLDPQESALIQKALTTSQTFDHIHDNRPSSIKPIEKAVADIVDFKTAAAKGIETGKIKSIIHPTLADHVRREAIKCADELKRTT